MSEQGPKLWARTRNNNPDPNSEMVRRVVDQARRLNDVAGSILRSAGIAVTETLMTITRGLRVEGTFESTGTANIGGELNVTGSMDVTGDASFGGTMDVTGDAVFSGNLAVPNGSITNAALASPVTGSVAAPAATSGFGFSTGFATKASTSIAVPAGFSRAVVIATGGVTGTDSSANRIDARVVIGGEAGATLSSLANLSTSVPASHSRVITGLSGGSISVEIQALSAVGIAGGSGNLATVTAMAMFFRS